jgi:hypothetical protein
MKGAMHLALLSPGWTMRFILPVFRGILNKLLKKSGERTDY